MKKCCFKQRNQFAKEILDILDEVVRSNQDLSSFILGIKDLIREVRDKK